MGNLTGKRIEAMIYVIRGQRMMLDSDLAVLYDVTTGNLNKAVQRNIERFPSDFMFQLSPGEYENLIFQNGISSSHGGRRFTPYVFSENGVAMLSSVLKSKQAIQVNILVMRVFTHLRVLAHKKQDIDSRIEKIEHEHLELKRSSETLFRVVFERLDEIETDAPILPSKRKRIGIKT